MVKGACGVEDVGKEEWEFRIALVLALALALTLALALAAALAFIPQLGIELIVEFDVDFGSETFRCSIVFTLESEKKSEAQDRR